MALLQDAQAMHAKLLDAVDAMHEQAQYYIEAGRFADANLCLAVTRSLIDMARDLRTGYAWHTERTHATASDSNAAQATLDAGESDAKASEGK